MEVYHYRRLHSCIKKPTRHIRTSVYINTLPQRAPTDWHMAFSTRKSLCKLLCPLWSPSIWQLYRFCWITDRNSFSLFATKNQLFPKWTKINSTRCLKCISYPLEGDEVGKYSCSWRFNSKQGACGHFLWLFLIKIMLQWPILWI